MAAMRNTARARQSGTSNSSTPATAVTIARSWSPVPPGRGTGLQDLLQQAGQRLEDRQVLGGSGGREGIHGRFARAQRQPAGDAAEHRQLLVSDGWAGDLA